MKNCLLLLFFLAFGFSAFGQHYDKYCNSLYNFCIDVPGHFTRKGETKTGTGQYFTARDGSTLSVYGMPNLQDQTLKQRFDWEQANLTSDTLVNNSTQLPTIEKAEIQENAFIIIYQSKDFTDLIYRKLENNSWKSIELHYPTVKEKEYAERIRKLVASFK